MRARHLQDVLVLLRLLFQFRRQIVERRRQLVSLVRQTDLDRRRKSVVRRLRHIGMIVRRDDVIAALRLAEDLECAVRQDLVHVHVDRCARAALNRVDGELVDEFAVDDLLRRLDERVADALFEAPCLHVRLRRRLLHLRERLDEVDVEPTARDAEILYGTQRLHAVIRLIRHLKFAEKIMFLAHCNPILSFYANRLSLVYIIQLFCHFVLEKKHRMESLGKVLFP